MPWIEEGMRVRSRSKSVNHSIEELNFKGKSELVVSRKRYQGTNGVSPTMEHLGFREEPLDRRG